MDSYTQVIEEDIFSQGIENIPSVKHINPFFVPVTGSQFKYIKTANAMKNTANIYIISKRYDTIDEKKIDAMYNIDTCIDTIKEISSEFIVHTGHKKLILTNSIKNGISEIEVNIIKYFDHDNVISDNATDKIPVFLMLDYSQENVKSLLKSYRSEFNFEKYKLLRNMNIQYNFRDGYLVNKMMRMLHNIPGSNYWCIPNNLRINKNISFKNRLFNIDYNNINKVSSDNKKRLVEQLVNTVVGMDGYDNDSKREYEPVSYYEIVEATCEKEYVDILNSTEAYDGEKEHLLSNLLASPRYCHIALKNNDISINLNKKSLLTYAITALYLEESKTFDAKHTDNFVFTIDQASKLVFNEDDNFIICPYKKPMIIHNGNHKCQRTIVNLEQFKARLNYFITGDSIDILSQLNLTNAVITGSAMAACIPSWTDNAMIDTLYCKSDVDICCNHATNIEFVNYIGEFRANLEKITSKKATIVTKRTACLVILKEDIEKLHENHMIEWPYDYIVQNLSEKKIKLFFYDIYTQNAHNIHDANRKYINDADYKLDIITLVSYENFTIVTNDKKYDFVADTDDIIKNYLLPYKSINIVVRETYKFTVSVPGMKPFELFPCRKTHDAMSTPAQFHLGCVRAIYDGINCYILPSALIAYLSGINIDFKYVNGKYNPCEIIKKFAIRGYATILNTTESKLISEITDTDGLSIEELSIGDKSIFDLNGNVKCRLV